MTPPAETWPEYRVRAKNIAAQSENRIHSDDIAQTLGFKGALISGVAVYSYMTHPLVERFGEGWMEHGTAAVEFYKPAYDGDLLTIRVEPGAGQALAVTAWNEGGVELARMHADPSAEAEPLEHLAGLAPVTPPEGAERVAAAWETVHLREPLWTLEWRPDVAENTAWADGVMDDLPLYREGAAPPLHPGYVLRAANRVLTNHFILPAWIHVSSEVRFHAVPRVGQRILLHAVPVEKYEKKGHQFAVVNMRMEADGATCVEVIHKLIFRVRAAA